MKTQLQHFDNFELETQIRVLVQDDQPWFIAKDICQNLGLENNRQALIDLDEDEKTVFTSSNVTTNDIRLPNRGLQAVSESGLYALIFKSKKPEAKKFRKWVTAEVLPAIRQTGKYDPTAALAALPPAVQHAAIYAQIAEMERSIAQLRTQADACIQIPGYYTVHHWGLIQGEHITGSAAGRLSAACKRTCDTRGIPTGLTRVIEHCGQTTRLSRNAHTFPETILTEVIGTAAA